MTKENDIISVHNFSAQMNLRQILDIPNKNHLKWLI